jgi:hypothetical protein
LVYNNKSGTTLNGYHFEARLLFDTNNEEKLWGFGGMLYDYEPGQVRQNPNKPIIGIVDSILHAILSILLFFFDALGKLGKWLIRRSLSK